MPAHSYYASALVCFLNVMSCAVEWYTIQIFIPVQFYSAYLTAQYCRVIARYVLYVTFPRLILPVYTVRIVVLVAEHNAMLHTLSEVMIKVNSFRCSMFISRQILLSSCIYYQQ